MSEQSPLVATNQFSPSTLKVQPKFMLPAKTKASANPTMLKLKINSSTTLPNDSNENNTLKAKHRLIEGESTETDTQISQEDDDYDYDIPENNKPTGDVQDQTDNIKVWVAISLFNECVLILFTLFWAR